VPDLGTPPPRAGVIPGVAQRALSRFTEQQSKSSSIAWYAGEFIAAIDGLTRQLEDAQSWTLAYDCLGDRGQIFTDLGYPRLGLRDLNPVLAVEREAQRWAYAQSARGYALGVLGRVEDAEAAFAGSLGAAPHNAWTYFRRGLVRLAHGQLSASLADIRRSLEETGPPLNDPQRTKASRLVEDLLRLGAETVA
jgi:tetratricopeptide (TPR) repeat protein